MRMRIVSTVVVAVVVVSGCFKQPHWVAADISETRGPTPDGRTADGKEDLLSPEGGTKDSDDGVDREVTAGDSESDCLPACGESQCGPDGCGGSCGECADLEKCNEGKCKSPPFHLWSSAWGGWKSDWVSAMAAMKGGGFVVAGCFESNTLVLAEDVVLKNHGGQDIFLVATDGSGVVQWGHAYGAEGQEYPADVAVDEEGGIYVVGSSQSATVSLGGDDIENPGKNMALVCKYTQDGNHQWSKGLGGPTSLSAMVVAAKQDEAVVAGGFMGDNLWLGELSVEGECAEGQCYDGYIASFDANGNPELLWHLGGDCFPKCLAVLPGGDLVVAGRSSDSCKPMGSPVLPSHGGDDVFVARIDGGGGLVWAKSFGGAGNDVVEGLAVSTGGDIVLAGTFKSTALEFGGQILENAGDEDAFVVRLTGDGDHVFSTSFGSESYDRAFAVAVGGDGSVYAGGQFGGMSLDFGGGDLIPIGETDAYVVKLSPGGAFQWAARYGGQEDEWVQALVPTGDGFAMTGSFRSPTIDFGGKPLEHGTITGGYSAVFIARMTE
jgi:hypothetical protein